jgi:hypothetical protein
VAHRAGATGPGSASDRRRQKAARDGALEKLVVSGIAAVSDHHGRRHDLRPAANLRQEGSRFESAQVELLQDLSTTQHGVELVQDGGRRENRELPGTPGVVEASGQAVGLGDRPAQEDLGVKNDARRRGPCGAPRR